MCCEDIQIGRKSRGVELVINVTNAAYPVVPADLNRISILFLGGTAVNNVVTTKQPTTNVDGLRCNSTSNPTLLTLAEHGDIVRQAWFGFGSAAGNMHVVVTSLDGMCEDG
jgi:hypothetical protein